MRKKQWKFSISFHKNNSALVSLTANKSIYAIAAAFGHEINTFDFFIKRTEELNGDIEH